MDLLERTRIVVDLLTGSDRKELARHRGLDPCELERWLRAFMEGGIAALERMQSHDARRGTAKVIPLFGPREPGGRENSEGHVEQR